ncbi:beta/gamma crystallin-related protein [Pseudoduganella danionis]|uniref:Beta/gamma crystallin 'Greek key' domain-containing protein n=1 Tax=Pseudoduganella danionis TaxID=1890295 RepID=A0ABW9SM97_9BURK|nr:beta/gamma crystallin-related protein [Pseudoduganella danionis]MTW33293.1 hypothetical protein [Pseudoduganella danionis]
MKISLLRFIRAAFVLALPVAMAQAGEITLYTHANFNGPAITLRGETPDLVPYNFNDRASSVVVRSGTWQLCEHADFRGRCMVVERGEYPVLAGFNDMISSVREIGGRGDWNERNDHNDRWDRNDRNDRNERGERHGRRWERDDERGHGNGREPIELFSQSGFNGARLGIRNEVRTLVDYDFNDQAGSIIVNEGRWELCEHADFGGRCIVLEPGRYEYLDNMNNRISSLRRIR